MPWIWTCYSFHILWFRIQPLCLWVSHWFIQNSDNSIFIAEAKIDRQYSAKNVSYLIYIYFVCWTVSKLLSIKLLFMTCHADIRNNNTLALNCLNVGFNIQKVSVWMFPNLCVHVCMCVFSMSYHLFNQANEWQPFMRRGGLIKAFPGTGGVQRKQQGRERGR